MVTKKSRIKLQILLGGMVVPSIIVYYCAAILWVIMQWWQLVDTSDNCQKDQREISIPLQDWIFIGKRKHVTLKL